MSLIKKVILGAAAIIIVLIIVFINQPSLEQAPPMPVIEPAQPEETPEPALPSIIEPVMPEALFSWPTSDKAADLLAAKANNPDTKAWLTIPNTDINHPIMQTDDNSFYLNHDQNGDYDAWGAYFADMYADLSSPENLLENTVIYGHTSGSENPQDKRFSELYIYLDPQFLAENPYIYLTVDDKLLSFEICAVFYSDIGFYYINPMPFNTDAEQFIAEINSRSEYIFDSQIKPEDKLLMLSTCSYKYDINNSDNHRFVIAAKLVPEERADFAFEINPEPKRPQP